MTVLRMRAIAVVCTLALAGGDAIAAGPRAYAGPEDAPVGDPLRNDATRESGTSEPEVVPPVETPPVETPPVDDPTAPTEPPASDDAEDDEVVEGESFATDRESVADAVDDYDELRDSPEGQIATRHVRGGIIMTATGGVMIIGAAILGGTDPCRRLAGNSCMTSARNRGALVMGIPGALILGAGLALLGVGIAKRRRIAAGVQADRTSAGLTISGRF
ncbi:MAG TPA: hypothetical protein VG755_12660 [Nannocystaceae bacterium]|nr:hypothetical protein [Nannocystaceae bacterium]